jgi:phosphopantetheinyl transferase
MRRKIAVVAVSEVWERRELFVRSLTGAELEVYARLDVEKRQREWLAGRIAAKRAVQKQVGLPFARIEIRVEESGRPIVSIVSSDRGSSAPPFLSITHSNEVAAAIASQDPIGLDLERIEPRDRSFEELVLTESDQQRLNGLVGPPRDEALTLLWCEKESYAKLEGNGLRIPFADLVIPDDVAIERGTIEVSGVRFAFALASPRWPITNAPAAWSR